MKKIVSLILLVLLITTITACNQNGVATDNDQPQSVARTDLNILQFGDLNSLNPVTNTSAFEGRLILQMFDSLTNTSPDFEIEPWVAESWDISDDGLEYTFYLRDDIYFHNGEKLTADDVVFTVERYLESPARASSYFPMQGAVALDDSTVKITMNFPFAGTLFLTSGLYIVSETAYTELGEQDFNINPVGSGAYEFVRWDEGQQIVMKANENYHLGPAQIKDLTFRIITDPNTAFVALETGDVDLYTGVRWLDFELAESNPNLATMSQPGVSYFYISINCERITDLRIRQAIMHAVNLDEMNIVVSEGSGTISEIPVLEGAEGYTKDFVSYEYNIEKAKQILEDAGYAPGELEYTYTYIESATNAKRGEYLQAQLNRIGINLILSPMELGAWFSSLPAGEYDFTTGGLTMNPGNTEWSYYMMFHSNGTFNTMNFFTEEIDEILDAARRELDRDARDLLLQQITKIIREEALYIPNFFTTLNAVYDKGLANVFINPNDYFRVHDFYWQE